jgi:hypothetical protein
MGSQPLSELERLVDKVFWTVYKLEQKAADIGLDNLEEDCMSIKYWAADYQERLCMRRQGQKPMEPNRLGSWVTPF